MSTPDDVLLNKAATIERCVGRARQEYQTDPATFATNITRQDAAILNIQRACEAALDWIEASLANSLRRMVSYRNIAVHDYQELQLAITVAVITKHLDEFIRYAQTLLLADSRRAPPA